MVTIKNIKTNGNIIQCDFYPEDSDIAGNVIFDKETYEIKELTYPHGYEGYRNHVTHVMWKLDDMDEYPEEIKVMWY